MDVGEQTIPPLVSLPQQDGVFILNKPEGPTSASCLKLFKKLGQKKIGHAGTLDPFASGVLIILLGAATRLADFLHESDKKVYLGTALLGTETDTWDVTGSIMSRKIPAQDIDKLIAAVEEWRFLEEQEVPAFSAAKLNGQPLYKLARQGKQAPRKFKKIKIHRTEVIDFQPPYLTFRVVCGSGVYMRSLAHSLGKRLNCGACLYKLTREYSHPFSIARAFKPEDLRADPGILEKNLIPVQDALPDWRKTNLSPAQAAYVRHGRAIPADLADPRPGMRTILQHETTALALGELAFEAGRPVWRVKRGLWRNT